MSAKGRNVDQMVIWFFGSLLAGLIPVGARYVVYLVCPPYGLFDIKDAVFLGLAMNLSNFNLINTRALPLRLAITLSSGFILMVLAFILGIFQLYECQNKSGIEIDTVKYITLGLTLLSTLLSLFANLLTAKFIKLNL